MLTELAKSDLQSLRQAGYTPTDDEIVELNDLAIRIERGKYTTPANHPRMGFAGGVVLHEPTIGGIEWFVQYGKNSAYTDENRFLTYLYMCAKCRDLEHLNSLTDDKQIRKEVKAFKRSLECTVEEVWRALLWVKYGESQFNEDENDRIREGLTDDEVLNSLWITVIAAAGAMGLSPDELKTHTQSELVGMLIQANLHARIPMKNSVAKDYIAYRQLIKKIERGVGNGEQ